MKRLAERSVRWLGFTRQGVIDAARQVYGSRAMTPARSMVFLVAGTALIGVGVTMFRRADLGVPPYDVLLSAVDRHSALSHGQAAWATSAVLFLLAAVLGSRPKVASLVYVALAGAMVDGSYALVGDPSNTATRWAFVVAGVAALTSGIAVVVHTTESGGAFEVLTRAVQIRGVNPQTFRTVLEVGVLAIGAVAGGRFGVATAVFALTIGPLLSAVLQALADHQVGRDLRLGMPQESEVIEHPSR